MPGTTRHKICTALSAAMAATGIAICSLAIAAAPTPLASPSSAPSPAIATAGATPSSATTARNAAAPAILPFPDAQTVIGYLSQVIGWYRHLAVEERLVSDLLETLFVADDRQMADEVLKLAFEFARADAQLLAKVQAPEGQRGHLALHARPANAAGSEIASKAADADADVKAAQDRIKTLQDQLAKAPARQRRALTSEITAVQSELDLATTRAEALHTILQFEAESFHQETSASASGLTGQIDALEKAVPEAETNRKAAAAPSLEPRVVQGGGILAVAEELFAINRSRAALDDTIELTHALAQSVQRLRAPLAAELTDIDRRGDALANATATGEVGALRQRQRDFQALIERHKLVTAAAIPLSKQTVVVTLYAANLERWRAAIERRSSLQFRVLMVRLAVLVILLGAIFGAAAIWRQITFRYVQDAHRRYQFLQARRILLVVVVAIVLLFNFANEIGSVATVMGFAAAGIAVALQNVILSVAGYFFLIGKFGIKVGDRVQVSGVTGDVIDIGLVKLSLMELGGNGNDRQPTGRVVVFSNAIVFQPSGNFFKQIPGTNFVWNEVSLMLAPDCDYRLAEKRLLEAVEEVFARYRESIQRQYIEAEQSLNLVIDSPKPQSRLHLTQAGLQVLIRYPAETRHAVTTADEVSRRLLDVLSREPTLRLVSPAPPNIRSVPQPTPGDGTPAS